MPTDNPQAEIERLKAKLKARDGQPGYKANVVAIRKRIAELEAELEEPDAA